MIGLKAYGHVDRGGSKNSRRAPTRPASTNPFLDFRLYPLAGAYALDKTTYRIRIKGKYPQWNYWMTMPFTAPCRGRPTRSTRSPGWAKKSLSLDSGPSAPGRTWR